MASKSKTSGPVVVKVIGHATFGPHAAYALCADGNVWFFTLGYPPVNCGSEAEFRASVEKGRWRFQAIDAK